MPAVRPAKHNRDASYPAKPFALHPGTINCSGTRLLTTGLLYLWLPLPSFCLDLELIVHMSRSYPEP